MLTTGVASSADAIRVIAKSDINSCGWGKKLKFFEIT